MQIDEVHAVGEGRVFTGTRALQHRLVDGTCGFQEAIQRASSMGGLPQDAPLALIDATPRIFSPLELLRGASREHLWMLDLQGSRV
jgi:protease-4